MKKVIAKIIYRLMPTNVLLRATNYPDFTEWEERIIGKELNRRFKTDEALEEACINILD